MIDATNLVGAAAPDGFASNAEYIKSRTGRPHREVVQPQLRLRSTSRLAGAGRDAGRHLRAARRERRARSSNSSSVTPAMTRCTRAGSRQALPSRRPCSSSGSRSTRGGDSPAPVFDTDRPAPGRFVNVRPEPPPKISRMRLSVLDQSPISEGSTGADALRNTLDLARLADELGYHRYWVAEHHGGPMLAERQPRGADRPDRRGHRRDPGRERRRDAPALQPVQGRRDVHDPGRRCTRAGSTSGSGGRAGTDPMTTFALQRDRRQAAPDDFPQQLAELLAYFDDSLPDGPSVPPPRRERSRAGPSCPTPWLLGSSPQSAIWAGQLGAALRVRGLHQLRGGRDRQALPRAVRTDHRPAPRPRTAVAVWVLCAPTDEEAQFLASSSRMTLHAAAAQPADPGAAAREGASSSSSARAEPLDGGTARAAAAIIGSPEKVRAELEQVAVEYGAEEVIVVTITYDHQARRRSYELLAEAFGLEPRTVTTRQRSRRRVDEACGHRVADVTEREEPGDVEVGRKIELDRAWACLRVEPPDHVEPLAVASVVRDPAQLHRPGRRSAPPS